MTEEEEDRMVALMWNLTTAILVFIAVLFVATI